MSEPELGSPVPADSASAPEDTAPQVPDADSGAPAATDEQPTPLSKNAQKKAAKAARFAAIKPERRAREREIRKEKKRLKRAADAEADAELGEGEGSRKRVKVEHTATRGPRTKFAARVVVDLGFDEMMSEKEVVSLTSQLGYTYSVNRKAVKPFEHLLFTSLNGRTFARMESFSEAAYKRWTGTEWWSDSYERLWKGKESETSESDNREQVTLVDQASVVYLTADSTEELMELKEGETYIIGGIVDHNRYKNLCLEKAEKTGIRTARLPIGTYLAQLPTRKVLTVNQVMEILLKWTETRDWEQSLYSVMPKRKFHQGKDRKGSSTDVDVDEKDVIVVPAEEQDLD